MTGNDVADRCLPALIVCYTTSRGGIPLYCHNIEKSMTRTRSLFLAIALTYAAFSGTTAYASFFGDFPDAIQCDITDNPTLGSAIFIITSRNQAGVTVYRHIAFTANTDYTFNSNGTFNSKNFPNATNCDNASIADIVSAGRARFFSNSSGVSVTSGAMLYFNLNACPPGWTRQVQLDRVINPDQPMVLCRKD